MSSSSSTSSSSLSSSSSSSNESPAINPDLCQVLINNKHSTNYRRKRKSIVMHPSPGQQSWLLSEVKHLQKEVKKLKKENATLMHLNWKLQETFPKMIDLLSGQVVHSSLNGSSTIAVPRSGNEEPTSEKEVLPESCPKTRKSTKRSTGEHKTNNTSSSSMALSKFLTEEQLNKACLNTTNYKKVIGNLMECLFTEEEMLSCSVTGINTSKQPLDACKTTALIDFITTNFPYVTVPQVKQRMGNKLRDKRQLQIRTASVNPAHWMFQQS